MWGSLKTTYFKQGVTTNRDTPVLAHVANSYLQNYVDTTHLTELYGNMALLFNSASRQQSAEYALLNCQEEVWKVVPLTQVIQTWLKLKKNKQKKTTQSSRSLGGKQHQETAKPTLLTPWRIKRNVLRYLQCFGVTCNSSCGCAPDSFNQINKRGQRHENIEGSLSFQRCNCTQSKVKGKRMWRCLLIMWLHMTSRPT